MATHWTIQAQFNNGQRQRMTKAPWQLPEKRNNIYFKQRQSLFKVCREQVLILEQAETNYDSPKFLQDKFQFLSKQRPNMIAQSLSRTSFNS